jgi:hypothetical protein
MLILFQYVNLRYLDLFSKETLFKNGVDPLINVENSIKEYMKWNTPAMLFSGALIFQHMLKIWFNIRSEFNIGIDKWTVLDTVTAVLNFVASIVIEKIDTSFFLTNKKEIIDYFMLLVLLVSWLRFFSYFLVWRAISKLLLTLIRMLGDTLVFLFLVACFILIMSSVFATLY